MIQAIYPANFIKIIRRGLIDTASL